MLGLKIKYTTHVKFVTPHSKFTDYFAVKERLFILFYFIFLYIFLVCADKYDNKVNICDDNFAKMGFYNLILKSIQN